MPEITADQLAALWEEVKVEQPTRMRVKRLELVALLTDNVDQIIGWGREHEERAAKLDDLRWSGREAFIGTVHIASVWYAQRADGYWGWQMVKTNDGGLAECESSAKAAVEKAVRG